MTDASEAAREAARHKSGPKGGQFGIQPVPEADDISLDIASHDETDDVPLTVGSGMPIDVRDQFMLGDCAALAHALASRNDWGILVVGEAWINDFDEWDTGTLQHAWAVRPDGALVDITGVHDRSVAEELASARDLGLHEYDATPEGREFADTVWACTLMEPAGDEEPVEVAAYAAEKWADAPVGTSVSFVSPYYPISDAVLGDEPPVVSFEYVSHVGTLDAADRGKQSYEGEGLSVSLDPDDWAQIAKLPGDTWTIERADGEPLRLISWHDLAEEDRDRIRAWGAEHNWITQRTVHAVTYFDDELERDVTDEFEDTDQGRLWAAESAEDYDTDVGTRTAWRPTESFPDSRITSDDDPTDVLLAHYIRTQRPDLDGVWWEDTYDPDTFSCPRGVLAHDLARYRRERA